MPQSIVPSDTKSSIPAPSEAKFAAQESASNAAGVQIGCCRSVTGKSKAINFKQQNSAAFGILAPPISCNFFAKNAWASVGCSRTISTNGVRNAWTTVAPRTDKSPSARAITRTAYSSSAVKNARSFARFSTPNSDDVQARTRCTSFKHVLGGRSPSNASTPRHVFGHSGANGKPSSPLPLTVTSTAAASSAVKSLGQPLPCWSSSSCCSPSTSSASTFSSLSLSPLSSLSLSSAALASSPPASPPLPASLSAATSPTAASSRPSARATRARSKASSFSARSRASSSGVFVRSVATALRSRPSVRTSWS
mmetsp:Transcript_2531/g.7262  ORF Transcript_2531/g.7262 Transcript_2531/m.7262 type:complete len:309 (-) Transcript_2531:788-1714(-)